MGRNPETVKAARARAKAKRIERREAMAKLPTEGWAADIHNPLGPSIIRVKIVRRGDLLRRIVKPLPCQGRPVDVELDCYVYNEWKLAKREMMDMVRAGITQNEANIATLKKLFHKVRMLPNPSKVKK